LLVAGSDDFGAPSMRQSIWISIPCSASRVLIVPLTCIGADAGWTAATTPYDCSSIASAAATR